MSTATLTREISIRCAHCKGRHGSVNEVRACALGHVTPIAPTFKPVSEPGMYRRDGEIYQVVKSKNNKLYAKRLVFTYVGGQVHKVTLEYSAGSIFNISANDRMTVDEVQKMGKLISHCVVCRKKLKVKKSIDAGIGPICAKRV